jgi:uncharacterized repeat protein (TIGR01451 family)
MNKKSSSKYAFINARVLMAFVFCLFGLGLSLYAAGVLPGAVVGPRPAGKVTSPASSDTKVKMVSGVSYKNDESLPLREIAYEPLSLNVECELKENPKTNVYHLDAPDAAVQDHLVSLLSLQQPSIPATTLNFDGIAFPGVVCSCAPNDPNGTVGLTQYLSEVNEGIQIFNKSNGASVLGPIPISSLWQGFGGVCENNGHGDGIILYDHFANRWIVSQFAGSGANPTDECIAVSTSPDATGSYYRYGFHLGTNYFDYPKLAVWPDAYYMSMNIFNAAGTTFMGPQPFAFDRTNMLLGNPATFVSPVGPLGSTVGAILPADIDGRMLPPSGAPETFVGFPAAGSYPIYHFHVDFGMPANSTWTTFASPAAAAFTQICPATRACVPQSGVTLAGSGLDAIGDRMMFRAAYRNFGDHESLVTNYTVLSNAVAGVRWIELQNVTNGPVTVFQESTYQPDTTLWRWLGSAAMDNGGNIAVGFSTSSATTFPAIHYAGRLAADPPNTLAQGEATLFAGTGSQSSTGNRWGDYSALTVDPEDDCTFWYTNEYYATTGQFNWRTRIGNFAFTQCVPLTAQAVAAISINETADHTSINPGTNLGFTLTVNSSGTDTATGLSFSDNLPSGPGINWSIDVPGAGFSISGSPPSQTLNFSTTTMPAGTSVTVHIVSSSNATDCGTVITNSAMMSSSNAGSASATASTSFDCTNCTPNAWTDNTPASATVPVNILDQGLAGLGTNLYMFSGVIGGAIPATNNAFKYNTSTNTWTSIAAFSPAVESPVTVCDGTQFCYTLGGTTGTAQTTNIRYDTVGGTYTTEAAFTTGRWAAGAAYFGGKIYLMGGFNAAGSATVNTLRIYTVSSNTWATGATPPIGLAFAAVTPITVGGVNYIYMAGGTTTSTPQNIVYRYNITANTWATVSGSMPATIFGSANGVVNGFWVFGGGFVNGVASNATYSYDPVGNTWTANASSMPQARARGAGAITSTSLYSIGGMTTAGGFAGTNDNQVYTPSLCPPGLLSVVSRQVHGGSGTFDLPLSTTNRVIEPRDGSGNFTIVFNFNEPVNSGTAAVTGGSVGSVNTSFSGNSMLVSLTGVNDQQALTITVNNVSGPGEGTFSTASTQVGFLIGDVNADSTVNIGDTIPTRSHAGQPLTSSNFQYDVNVDGQIDVGDSAVVRSKSGDFVP